MLRQSALRDGGQCCKEALLPSKALRTHAMCCSAASQLVSVHFTKWKENCDWNVGGNYIPSANYQVQVEGHFITDGVCVAVTALAQIIQFFTKKRM